MIISVVFTGFATPKKVLKINPLLQENSIPTHTNTLRAKNQDADRLTTLPNDLIVESFRKFYEEGPLGVALVGLDFHFIQVNTTYCRMVGWSKEELQGKTFNDITHPEDAKEDERLATSLKNGEISSYHLEKRYLKKSGEAVWVELTVSLIRDQNGKAKNYLSMVQDIEERKHSEKALQEAKESAEQVNIQLMDAINHARELATRAQKAEQAKGRFLAAMSHEIRTPLNAILGMINMLSESEPVSNQKEYVDTIRRSGDTLATLINNVLDYSKLDAKKVELEKNRFELSEVVGESVLMVVDGAELKQLEINYAVDPEIPCCLLGDAYRLRQVFLNLLGNAVKFTDTGQVDCRVRLIDIKEDFVQLEASIADTGKGMSNEALGSLFSAFSQGHPSISRHYGGSGLGLVISRHIISLMNGEIGVKTSTRDGSIFTVTFEIQYGPCIKKFSANSQRKAVIFSPSSSRRRMMESLLLRENFSVESFEGYPTSPPQEIDFLFADYRLGNFPFPQTVQKKKPIRVLLTPFNKNFLSFSTENFDQTLATPCLPSQLRQILNQSAEEKISPLLPHPTLGETYPLRILLVEDHIVNRRVASLLLKRLGFHTDLAVNGKDAFDLYLKNPYEVILMDLQMPVLDGLEATKMIRAHEKEESLRKAFIIALTADVLHETKQQCLHSGMNAFLAKPIQLGDLKRLLEQAIRYAKESK